MTENGFSSKIVKLRQDLARNPRLFVLLAHEYLQSGMRDMALPLLLRGTAEYPDYVAGWGMLGQAYLQNKDVEAARGAFQQIVVLNPSHISAHKKLAYLYEEEGERSLALQSLRTVLSIDPSDREAKAALSNRFREGDCPPNPSDRKAKAALSNLSIPESVKTLPVTSAPDVLPNEATASTPVISQTLAALYMRQGHHKEAAAVYQALAETVRLQPQPAERVAHADPQPPDAQRLRRLQEWLAAIQTEKARHSILMKERM